MNGWVPLVTWTSSEAGLPMVLWRPVGEAAEKKLWKRLKQQPRSGSGVLWQDPMVPLMLVEYLPDCGQDGPHETDELPFLLRPEYLPGAPLVFLPVDARFGRKMRDALVWWMSLIETDISRTYMAFNPHIPAYMHDFEPGVRAELAEDLEGIADDLKVIEQCHQILQPYWDGQISLKEFTPAMSDANQAIHQANMNMSTFLPTYTDKALSAHFGGKVRRTEIWNKDTINKMGLHNPNKGRVMRYDRVDGFPDDLIVETIYAGPTVLEWRIRERGKESIQLSLGRVLFRSTKGITDLLHKAEISMEPEAREAWEGEHSLVGEEVIDTSIYAALAVLPPMYGDANFAGVVEALELPVFHHRKELSSRTGGASLPSELSYLDDTGVLFHPCGQIPGASL